MVSCGSIAINIAGKSEATVHLSSGKLAIWIFALISFVAVPQARSQQKELPWANVAEGLVPLSAELHIKVDGGAVRIDGREGSSVSYTVRHRSATRTAKANPLASLYKVSSYVQGGASWLVVTQKDQRPSLAARELVVAVPKRLRFVQVDTPGGDISVHGVEARVRVTTGGGHISLGNIEGAIDAQTGGEDIDVDSITGDARFHTGGGRITVGYVSGNVDAWTGGGTIRLDRGMRDAVLETGAGDVQVTYVGGELKVIGGGGNLILGDVASSADLRTIGGNIHLRSARGFVQAHTDAGNIELMGVPGANADTEAGHIVARFVAPVHPSMTKSSSLRTPTGDISVYLPPNLPITIQASVDLAVGHRIDSDFPQIVAVHEGENSDASLVAVGKLNGGGPLLKIHTSTGNIRLIKSQN